MKKVYAFLILGSLLLTSVAQSAPTAEELWQKIQILQRQGPPKRPVTTVAEHNAMMLESLDSVDQACDEFIQEYPNDKRIWEAKVDKLEIGIDRFIFNGKKINPADFESSVKELVDSSETTKPVKSQASFLMLLVRARALIAEPQPNKLPDFDQALTDFTATYPNDPNNRKISDLRLEVYEKNDPAKAKELLTQLASDPNLRVALDAQSRLKIIELQSHPINLKFTAVDGTDFDITKWRGKVVLVDFWATWCGPCKMVMPQVLETYGKFHSKGFEIVGISLDQDQNKLQDFTKNNAMTWPQFFDGKGWQNAISSDFGIHGIPAMWLVDKKGIIRSTDAGEDLENKIQQLLAE